MLIAAVLMLTAMLVLMRCFVIVKLAFVGLFLLISLFQYLRGKVHVPVRGPLLNFYTSIALIGLVWSLVGLLYPHNFLDGILNSMRLYVLWSCAFFVLYQLLRSIDTFKVFDRAIVIAGIIVPAINLTALYSVVTGKLRLPEFILDQMNLEIGFGNGVPQFSSANIISLFVILPYLLTLHFRTDFKTTKLTKLALFVSLILAAASGRRALWMIVVLTPPMVLCFSWLTGSNDRLGKWTMRFLILSTLFGAIFIGAVYTTPETAENIPAIARLRAGLTEDEVRSEQRRFMVRTFLDYPLLGKGLGSYGGIVRDDEHPWIYELTYFQMLFNIGLVGVTLLAFVFFFYFWRARTILSKHRVNSARPFALMIGLFSLLLAAYTNPYLGGFDSLFFVGLLPLICSFPSGFSRTELATCS